VTDEGMRRLFEGKFGQSVQCISVKIKQISSSLDFTNEVSSEEFMEDKVFCTFKQLQSNKELVIKKKIQKNIAHFELETKWTITIPFSFSCINCNTCTFVTDKLTNVMWIATKNNSLNCKYILCWFWDLWFPFHNLFLDYILRFKPFSTITLIVYQFIPNWFVEHKNSTFINSISILNIANGIIQTYL